MTVTTKKSNLHWLFTQPKVVLPMVILLQHNFLGTAKLSALNLFEMFKKTSPNFPFFN